MLSCIKNKIGYTKTMISYKNWSHCYYIKLNLLHLKNYVFLPFYPMETLFLT